MSFNEDEKVLELLQKDLNEKSFRNLTTDDLPQWIQSLLPTPDVPVVLDYAENKGYFVNYNENHPDSAKIDTVYDDIEELYDYLSENDVDFVFNENISDTARDGMIFLENSRLLVSSTSESKVRLLASGYLMWLQESYTAFVNDMDDFMSAYYFLNEHPCFWTKPNYAVDDFDWSTTDAVLNFWHMPMIDKGTGKVCMAMESGAHIAPDYTSTYHDLRLDVYADSYEKAIIETAKLVHKFFDAEGNERENVEYEKSDLEILLEERIDELDKKGFYSQEDDEDENKNESNDDNTEYIDYSDEDNT